MTVDIQDYANLVSGNDWSAALQAAVDSGHKVIISEGVYEIHAAVELVDDCFIEGEHPTKSILKAKKLSYGSQKLFNGVDKRNITIRNLVMNGNAADVLVDAACLPNANTTLLYLKACENIVLENIEVKNFASLFNESPTDPSLKVWSSIFIYACLRVKLESIYQHHCKAEGIMILDSVDVHVNGFISEQNLSDNFDGYAEGDLGPGFSPSKEIWTPLAVMGYSQTGQCKNIQITNCRIDGSGGSLVNINGQQIVLSDLTLSNAGHDFIDLGTEGLEPGELSKHVTINNVVCSDSRDINPTAGGAALLFSGLNLSVSNFVAQNTQSGIFIGSENISTKRVTLTNVLIDGCYRKTNGTAQSIGMQIARCEDVMISNADVNNVYDYGIVFYEAVNGSIINSCVRNIEALNPVSIYDSHRIKLVAVNVNNTAVSSYAAFLITDQYSSTNGCTDVLISDCHLEGTLNYYGISLDKSLQTSCYNNFGKNELFQTNGTNSLILSSQNEINYRTPLRWGANYLFIDDSGKVRVKSAAPVSSADGTVVGNQT
jgi:hypothetical protein